MSNCPLTKTNSEIEMSSDSSDEDIILYYILRRRKQERKKANQRKSWIVNSLKHKLETRLENQMIYNASSGEYDIKIKVEDPLNLPGPSHKCDHTDVKVKFEETETLIGFIKTEPSEVDTSMN